MKFKLLFAFSVIVNLIFAAWFLVHPNFTQHPSGNVATSLVPAETARSAESPVPAEKPLKNSHPSAVPWVQALRDGGMSEKVIADVALANFEERWHRLALENQKKFDRGEINHAALMQFDLQHDGEQEKELRAELGDEGYRHWDETRVLADIDRAGVQLSSDENDQLYQMRKDLDRKRLELDIARQQGKLADEEASSQSAALYTQYNQQLLKFLGDDRYAQIQNGGDSGIGALKQSLGNINANDSQVAGMETAKQTWDSQRTELDLKLQKGDVTAEDYEKQMKALEAQRDQEYQKVLGADGFAEFQRNRNPQYQALKNVGASIGFSDDDINNLYTTIQNYQNGVNDYRSRAQALADQGQTIDWPGVEKALQNFSQQTETALRDQLGDKFDKLKRSNLMPFER